MKNERKKSLLTGSIIAFLIAAIPYLLFVNQNIPKEISKIDFFFIEINSGYYKNLYTYTYWFTSKFVPLFLFFIWFITCKHWWVHVLIIPISIYLFQLISVVNDTVLYVDEIEFIYTVPIATIIMALLYFLRSKLSVYIQAVDLKKEMDDNMKIPTKFKDK